MKLKCPECKSETEQGMGQYLFRCSKCGFIFRKEEVLPSGEKSRIDPRHVV